VTARIIANRFLEAEDPLDPREELHRYAESPFPGYTLEREHNHWNVYRVTGANPAFIGEITYDDMADMPRETMTPEQIAHWDSHRWCATAGWREGETQFCSTFEAAMQFIIAVNTVKTLPVRKPPVREAAEDDVDDPSHYLVPLGIELKRDDGREFYAELTFVANWQQRLVPLVTLYDRTHVSDEWPKGQLICRYYASDLVLRKPGVALDMHGGVPQWKLDARTSDELVAWLKDELENKRRYRLRKDVLIGSVYESDDVDDPKSFIQSLCADGLTLVRDDGRTFYAQLYFDRKAQPSVTIYDCTHINARWPKGQPVSSYYAATLVARAPGAGLSMQGDVPEWSLDARNVDELVTWLKDELENRRGYRLRHDGILSVYESDDEADDEVTVDALKGQLAPPNINVVNKDGQVFYVELRFYKARNLPRLAAQVVFYDTERLQAVMRYDTLIGSLPAGHVVQRKGKIVLDDSVLPPYTVDAPAADQVRAWLRQELEVKRRYTLRPHGYSATYESEDADSPELFLHPGRHMTQPNYELRKTELQSMLRPYYPTVTVQHRPAHLAHVFKGLPEYVTWVVHCRRTEPLRLPRHLQNKPVDWRKQCQQWFVDWAARGGLWLSKFQLYGRLRFDPTFTFDTYVIDRGRLKENLDDQQLAADQAEEVFKHYTPRLSWERNLEADLRKVRETGVLYRVLGVANVVLVSCDTYFDPAPLKFIEQVRDFVVQWLKDTDLLPVTSVETRTVAKEGEYPRWNSLVAINVHLV